MEVGTTPPRRFGRLATVLALACLVLGAVLLWKLFGANNLAGGTSGVTAPEAESVASPSPYTPPTPPPSGVETREPPPSAEGLSKPIERSVSSPKADDD